jgi:chromosomal replication initiation ATPase DnaA
MNPYCYPGLREKAKRDVVKEVSKRHGVQLYKTQTQLVFDKVAALVADRFFVKVEALAMRNAKVPLPTARFCLWMILKRYYEMSYDLIGQISGARDGNTIYNGIRTGSMYLESDSIFYKRYRQIVLELGFSV